MGRRRAADVVLGRLAAEEHDEVDPLRVADRRLLLRRDGTVRRREIAGSDVAAATGGRCSGPDVALDGASFDSRIVRPGQLFVPIVADRDGHDFIAAALAAGAGAYLTQAAAPASGHGDRGRRHRGRAAGAGGVGARRGSTRRVVGDHRRVGKTSTKDLARRRRRRSRASRPTSAASTTIRDCRSRSSDAPDDTEVLVLEMGMRGSARSPAVRGRPADDRRRHPVADAHTERVGGIDGVAGEGRADRGAPADGAAVLNADDARVAAMADPHRRAAVVTFGTSLHRRRARRRDIEVDELARPSFRVALPVGEDVRSPCGDGTWPPTPPPRWPGSAWSA